MLLIRNKHLSIYLSIYLIFSPQILPVEMFALAVLLVCRVVLVVGLLEVFKRFVRVCVIMVHVLPHGVHYDVSGCVTRSWEAPTVKAWMRRK